jgi:hypothetical protein
METSEATPLTTSYNSYQSSNSEYSISDGSDEGQNDDDLSYEDENRLGNDLMKCNNNDELENVMLSKALKVAIHSKANTPQHTMSHLSISRKEEAKKQRTIFSKMVTLISIALIGVLIIFVLVQVGQLVTGPPSQPVGPYKLVAVQVSYTFLAFILENLIQYRLTLYTRMEMIFSIIMYFTMEKIRRDQKDI